MSRTYAHVPADVELSRVQDPLILPVAHVHWAPDGGRVSCHDPQARCHPYVPRWASAQPRMRRGTAAFERTSRVRDVLRLAAKQYRATGDVDDVVLPAPVTYCLCMYCGVR